MDERLRDWRPTPEEIKRIMEEMRPIIKELARRGISSCQPVTGSTAR